MVISLQTMLRSVGLKIAHLPRSSTDQRTGNLGWATDFHRCRPLTGEAVPCNAHYNDHGVLAPRLLSPCPQACLLRWPWDARRSPCSAISGLARPFADASFAR